MTVHVMGVPTLLAYHHGNGYYGSRSMTLKAVSEHISEPLKVI